MSQDSKEQVCLFYITCPNKEEATKIASKIVNLKLAACANIIDSMSSLYWWEGEVQHDNETLLILKTKESLEAEVIDKVKELHSYSCPCIIKIPIEGGHEAYLKWLATETK